MQGVFCFNTFGNQQLLNEKNIFYSHIFNLLFYELFTEWLELFAQCTCSQ